MLLWSVALVVDRSGSNVVGLQIDQLLSPEFAAFRRLVFTRTHSKPSSLSSQFKNRIGFHYLGRSAYTIQRPGRRLLASFLEWRPKSRRGRGCILWSTQSKRFERCRQPHVLRTTTCAAKPQRAFAAPRRSSACFSRPLRIAFRRPRKAARAH